MTTIGPMGKRFKNWAIVTGAGITLAITHAAHADGMYDDYYKYYPPQPQQAAPRPVPSPTDNDNYYVPPVNQSPTDDTYPAPYSYQTQPSHKLNCNTIGDMPSCGDN